jgi:hypothetical protein
LPDIRGYSFQRIPWQRLGRQARPKHMAGPE